MRAGIAGLGFVVGLLLAVGLDLAIAPPALKRDLRVKEEVPSRLYRGDGLVNPPDMPYGLNDPETAPDGSVHRWTTSHATLNFPYEAQYGERLHVSLSMAGGRASGQPPADVTLGVNGRTVARFRLSDDYRVYDASIDAAQT